jgi:nitrogen fixation protein NifU and related proteins
MSESPADEGRPATTGGEAPAPPLDSLYHEIILSHYRRPRNHRPVDDPTARIHMNNPSCGDEIALSLRMEDDRIADVGFTGQGCSISQSSASMMTVLLRGRTLAEAGALSAAFRDLVHGRLTPEESRHLGDLRALAGVARYPVRVRCALLAWNAFSEASPVADPSDQDDSPA